MESIYIVTASGLNVQLNTGREYVITYRLDGQRYDREARMSFLGRVNGELQWNARPAAGTQHIAASVIVTVLDVGASKGREDPARYVGRRAEGR